MAPIGVWGKVPAGLQCDLDAAFLHILTPAADGLHALAVHIVRAVQRAAVEHRSEHGAGDAEPGLVQSRVFNGAVSIGIAAESVLRHIGVAVINGVHTEKIPA